MTTRYHRNSVRRATIGVLFVAASLLLGACGEPETSAEEEVRQWLRQGQEAAEAKQRRRLVDMISPAYTDARGNERDDIDKLMRYQFLRQNSVKLLPVVESVKLFGDSAAEVELSVGMAGTNDTALGLSARAYRFLLELERDDGSWRLISARWARMGRELR